jgi:PAS domain S-box-containing protein
MAVLSESSAATLRLGAKDCPADRECEWLAEIFDRAGYAIVAKSLDGIISRWNSAAERLFGYPAEEIVGRPVTMLFRRALFSTGSNEGRRSRSSKPIAAQGRQRHSRCT